MISTDLHATHQICNVFPTKDVSFQLENRAHKLRRKSSLKFNVDLQLGKYGWYQPTASFRSTTICNYAYLPNKDCNLVKWQTVSKPLNYQHENITSDFFCPWVIKHGLTAGIILTFRDFKTRRPSSSHERGIEETPKPYTAWYDQRNEKACISMFP